MAAEFGVYVHFPWCLSKCPYCDFVAFAATPESIDHQGYADAVLAELAARASSVGDARLATVFFGGGTPSLWDPLQIRRVLRAVRDAFRADDPIEVSLECDPSSLDQERARALADAGIGRLSIGVQALDDERLRFLGRIHTAADARRAIAAATRVGSLRVSTDLMYAVADQAPERTAAEAEELVQLGATHVSAYSLTIEPDTPFGHLARRGRLPLCDDGMAAATFFAIDEALARAGLEHYEVSNYAAPGQRAQHNVGYWRGRDYLGLGCGAYGTVSRNDGTAVRYRNQANARAYVSGARGNLDALTASEERLDAETRLRERIMLGLRMKDGLDLEAAAHELGVDPFSAGRVAALERLEARGRIARRGSHIAVPRDAWIWADDTAAALF
jgi:oxygen-independent coproporphyrinogen-3 oxidase